MTETAASPAERVLQETLRFRAALPELLAKYPGKWVVFKDGKVDSVHDTEELAYTSALRAFGREGGMVVAQVVAQDPRPITAGVMFRIA